MIQNEYRRLESDLKSAKAALKFIGKLQNT